MSYYAGLDVSLEETAICVVDGAGRIVKEMRAPSEPEALVAALRETGLAFERIGLEACSLTAWLHDALRGEGLPAVCIETRQANAAMKTMPNKTDRNERGRWPRSCARAGSGRSMSKAARAGCGAPFWSPAAPCSTRCGRSRTWCGLFCARPASSSARPPARPLRSACANWPAMIKP